MPFRRFGVLPVMAGLLLCAASAPARADFYSLAGRFQCLDEAKIVCGDPQPLPARPAASPPAAKPRRPNTAQIAPLALRRPPSPPAAKPPRRVARAVTPPAAIGADATSALAGLRAIAARVQSGRPSRRDIAALEQAADTGNASAIELLAWCKLYGLGTARDPVEAYILYGAAARAAAPKARENQAAIYEQDLTSHQRQLVLDLANEGVAMAQLPH